MTFEPHIITGPVITYVEVGLFFAGLVVGLAFGYYYGRKDEKGESPCKKEETSSF